MGQSQSTRRGTPSYRLAQPMGRSKIEDSDASEHTTSKTSEEGFINAEGNEFIDNNESKQTNESGENSIKQNTSIPIVTVTGKIRLQHDHQKKLYKTTVIFGHNSGSFTFF